MNLSRLAILGPGLLGGSIALATAARLPTTRVRVWARREEALAEIRARGLADIASTDVEPIVRDADIVVLCVPIGAMPALAAQIAPHLRADTLVTDVGSVKAEVVARLAPIFSGRARFVGSHPMAGSEQAGIGAARAGLFERAACIITPSDDASRSAAPDAAEFWSALGGVPRELSPAEHDEVVALVSHLPHLAAAAVANLVCGQNPEALNFCGNGFRDTTRVASGHPGMWAEILAENSAAVRRAGLSLIAQMRDAIDLLDHPDRMAAFLAEAKRHRDALPARN